MEKERIVWRRIYNECGVWINIQCEGVVWRSIYYEGVVWRNKVMWVNYGEIYIRKV